MLQKGTPNCFQSYNFQASCHEFLPHTKFKLKSIFMLSYTVYYSYQITCSSCVACAGDWLAGHPRQSVIC